MSINDIIYNQGKRNTALMVLEHIGKNSAFYEMMEALVQDEDICPRRIKVQLDRLVSKLETEGCM